VKARPVSVVICTKDRAWTLARLLALLRHQNYPASSFEIIVVDNRSMDRTAALVEEMSLEPGIPIRCVGESRVGITYARNSGADAARFETIAYIDDDCTPSPDWLEQLMRGFDLDPQVEIVGGRVVVDWDSQPAPRWYGLEVERSLAGTSHLGQSARILDPVPRVIECNMAIRKAAWQTGGGFLGMEQFGSRHCAASEVVSLIDRITSKGGKVAYLPQAVIRHHVGKRDLHWMLARAYWQGVSDGLMDALLYRRSTGMLQRVAVDAAALLALLGVALGSSFLGSFPRALSPFLRAVRRLGLLVCELHLAGDWQKVRAWKLECEASALGLSKEVKFQVKA
jgi:glycosyltransferase involved in cell wall biosynthesis